MNEHNFENIGEKMRLSFEKERSYRPGDPSHVPAGRERFGLPRKRRCLNCNREIEDNGTVLFLRGFCSQKCLDAYIRFDQPGDRYWEREEGGFL